MEAAASFVFSDTGKVYGRVCQFWGVDPAGSFSDDVLAHAVRTGLFMALAEEEDKEPSPVAEPSPQVRTQGSIVTDLEEQMRAYE